MADQKQLRVEVSQDILDSTNSNPDFMNTIITSDKSWVYGYDPETKSDESTNHYLTQMLHAITDAIDRREKIHACV